jgi:tetratricopeptide (TPR) repeat protein
LQSLVATASPPESEALALRLTDLLEAQGQGEAARSQLRQLLEATPDNVEALSRLARLAEKDDNSDDAVLAYRGLLKQREGGDLVETAFSLIDACERAERLGEILDDLEHVLSELPEHEKLRERIRAVYEKSGETRRLTQLLVEDAGRREKPQTKALLLAQAARLVIDDDPEQAARLLEDAERAHSTLESGLLLARLRAVRGQREEAVAELSRLAQPDESRKPAARVAAYLELADLHLSADELAEAHLALAEAHRLERRNGEVALLLGMLSLDLDDEKLAARALRSVTAMKSSTSTTQGVKKEDKSKAYFLLGILARKNGDTSGARRMVQKAVGEDPKNQDAHALLKVIN